MFDLEQSIAEWRQQMLAAGIQSPVPLEELEVHLSEEIERKMKLGLNEQESFRSSVLCIGSGDALKIEFRKIDVRNWNRPLAWIAWILFLVSFFLPSHKYGGYGWECAQASARCLISSLNWSEFSRGNMFGIYDGLLTLANLLMLASLFLLPRFSHNAQFLKWQRFTAFAALALVWSFILYCSFGDYGNDWKIGAYVWATSFALLFSSTFRIRSHKTKLQKEQYV